MTEQANPTVHVTTAGEIIAVEEGYGKFKYMTLYYRTPCDRQRGTWYKIDGQIAMCYEDELDTLASQHGNTTVADDLEAAYQKDKNPPDLMPTKVFG